MDQQQNQTIPQYNVPPSNPINGNTPNPTTHRKFGPIVATLIIVIIIIIIALFALSSNLNKQNTPVENVTSDVTTNSNSNQITNLTTTVAPEVKAVTNKADDLQSLQSDLNASTQNVDAQSI